MTLAITRGKLAEEEACRFLLQQGLQLIEANYRCYHGEIDLIMRDKKSIIFVEVRSRSDARHGHALETVTTGKQQRIIKASQHFLQRKKWLNKVYCRFDVVAIQVDTGKKAIDWLKNAFEGW